MAKVSVCTPAGTPAFVPAVNKGEHRLCGDANRGCEGWLKTFEFVVRCNTLLAYADAVGQARVPTPSAGVADADADADGDEDDRSQAQVVVKGGGVPWAAWGPRATSLSDQTHVK